jgi:hypothetical protein
MGRRLLIRCRGRIREGVFSWFFFGFGVVGWGGLVLRGLVEGGRSLMGSGGFVARDFSITH